MTPTTRMARSSDASEIARLTDQLGYDITASQASDRLSRILSQPNHALLVAEGDGQLIGWVHASAEIGIETGAFVRIGGLVVDGRFRQQGVGRALMAHIEEWAKGRGSPVVRLWSSVGRFESHQFYEHLGYTKVKTQHSFVKWVNGNSDDLTQFVPRV